MSSTSLTARAEEYARSSWKTVEQTFSVHAPATGETLGEVPDCGPREAEHAADLAAASFATWSHRNPFERSAILRRWHTLIAEHRSELAELIAAEVGKPTDVLMGDRRIRKVTFTGSHAVGILLYRRAADTVKAISLELGGHAPFLVFGDADIEAAVAEAVKSKFRYSGQTCLCTNRLYVHERVVADFTQAYAEQVSGLNVGDPFDESTDIGPLIDEQGTCESRPPRLRRHHSGRLRPRGWARRDRSVLRAHGPHRRQGQHGRDAGGDFRTRCSHPASDRIDDPAEGGVHRDVGHAFSVDIDFPVVLQCGKVIASGAHHSPFRLTS